MGWSGSKIVGHSGTSFKNRKGFEKIRLHYERTRYSYEDAPELNDSKSIKKSNSPLHRNERKGISEKIVMLCGLLFTLILSVFIVSHVDDNIKFDRGVKSMSYQEKLHFEREALYEEYTYVGFDNLRRKELDNSQLYFSKALDIDQCGKDARIGITKVLNKQCTLHRLYCSEFEENLSYLQSMNYETEFLYE